MTSKTKPGKKMTKSAPKRKRAVPLWKERRVRLGAGLAIVLGLIGGVWHLDRTGWIEVTSNQISTNVIQAFAKVGFQVQDVLVVGRDRTDQAAILSALQVERGSALFGFDPQDAQARIETLPWVLSATVERLFPDTVLVQVQERKPMALWQKDGAFALIDQSGNVIIKDNLEPFATLPVVVGEGAPKHAGDLMAMLKAEPHLATLVRAAVRVGDRRWNLRLVNDIDVRLPEQEARDAWKRLGEYQRKHRVLERDIRVLDLRIPDRLIVETNDSKETETLQRVSDQRT